MKRKDTEELKEYWRSIEEIAHNTRMTFPLWKLPEDVAKDWADKRKPTDLSIVKRLGGYCWGDYSTKASR